MYLPWYNFGLASVQNDACFPELKHQVVPPGNLRWDWMCSVERHIDIVKHQRLNYQKYNNSKPVMCWITITSALNMMAINL